MDIAISVKNLSKKYRLYDSPKHRLKEALNPFRKKYHRDFWALKDVSFDVKSGETIGIIGKNGSGKSTLLQIIYGILQPTTGSVETNGRISALLELGVGFNKEFRGRDNVFMQGSIMGFNREEMERRFDQIADFADIGNFIDQPVKIYSSGMLMRLAFATHTLLDPNILIVDEALAVGDMSFQIKCFGRMNQLREKGTTILFVSHSLNTVLSFCERALYLRRGEQMAFGPVSDVVNQYQQDCMAEKMVPRHSMASADVVLAERMPTTDPSVAEAERLASVARDYRESFQTVATQGAREGSQSVSIDSFVLVRSDGTPVETISPTEEIAGCFLLKFNAKFEGMIHLSIQILDKCGSPVMVVRDSNFEQSVSGVSGKRWLGVTRFTLPLQAGIYYCKIGVLLYPPFKKYRNERHDFEQAEISDLIEHGAHIRVLSFVKHPIPVPVLNESKITMVKLENF